MWETEIYIIIQRNSCFLPYSSLGLYTIQNNLFPNYSLLDLNLKFHIISFFENERMRQIWLTYISLRLNKTVHAAVPHLTSAWLCWSSDSYPCQYIFCTLSQPVGLTAQLLRESATRRLPSLSSVAPSPAPDTHLTARCHGYHHIWPNDPVLAGTPMPSTTEK